jgi:hypothetical protein
MYDRPLAHGIHPVWMPSTLFLSVADVSGNAPKATG